MEMLSIEQLAAARKIAREFVIFLLLGGLFGLVALPLLILIEDKPPHAVFDMFLAAGWGALCGAVVAACIWLLYRLIRFAWKG
jgi:hypothetical protein